MNNIVPLFPQRKPAPARVSTLGAEAAAFQALTDLFVMKQAEAGTLNPAIVAALLAAVRQPVGEAAR